MSTETTGPEAPPQHSNRFFTWMRGTGIQRQPGWIGGVCAGIAERIGVDPLIVRGIVVVVAILGGPAILLYAAAWLLLPDRFDVIHLEQLFRGRLGGPVAAIAALVVLSMLPVTQGFWSAGAAFWGGGAGVGRVLWTIVLLGALVAIIVWIARANPRMDGSDAAPGRPMHHGAAAAARNHGTAAPTAPLDADAAAPTTVTPPPRPPRPGADATTEDFAAWRDQQAAWKAERAAFQAEELATIRESNLARSKERREAAEARAAEAAEHHRAWDRANPALPGAVVAITIGLAFLVGGIAALVASGFESWDGSEVVAGLGTATVLLGVVIVAAAAFGRRNGFMIFLSVVLLLATLIAAALPNNRQFVGSEFSPTSGGRFTQLAGQTSVYVDSPSGGTLDLWQGVGGTQIEIAEGSTVRIEVTSYARRVTLEREVATGYVAGDDESYSENDDGSVAAVFEDPTYTRTGNEFEYAATIGPGAVPDETIRIWQGGASTFIIDHNKKAATP